MCAYGVDAVPRWLFCEKLPQLLALPERECPCPCPLGVFEGAGLSFCEDSIPNGVDPPETERGCPKLATLASEFVYECRGLLAWFAR